MPAIRAKNKPNTIKLQNREYTQQKPDNIASYRSKPDNTTEKLAEGLDKNIANFRSPARTTLFPEEYEKPVDTNIADYRSDTSHSKGVIAPMKINNQLNIPPSNITILSSSNFGIMPGMFRNQLARYSTAKIPKLYDPRSQKNGDRILMPMVPLEDKGFETVRKSWDDMNDQIAKDIDQRMKAYFSNVKKKKVTGLEGKKKRKKIVKATNIWRENMPVVASNSPIGVETKTWTAYGLGDSCPEVMQAIFASLTDGGFGWCNLGESVDLYKRNNIEVAVFSDGDTVCVSAFSV